MSLNGRTILITRQVEQASEFVAEVERRGGKAVVIPMIHIAEPESWDDCDAALSHFVEIDVVVFASVNAVEGFLRRCELKRIQPSALSSKEIIAVGEKTRHLLEQRGVHVSFIPETFNSAALAIHFASKEVRGKRFLLPRGNLGRSELEMALIEQGAHVESALVYRNIPPDRAAGEKLKHGIEGNQFDVITFASPSAVDRFADYVTPEDLKATRGRAKIAVIGPTTRAATLKHGFPVDIEARQPTVGGLVDAIERILP